MLQRSIITCFLFVFALSVNGQQQKVAGSDKFNGNPGMLHCGIKVIARAYDDSVVLRWAPQEAWAWSKLNTVGYRIERIDLSVRDQPKTVLLTTVALKPYSLEKFKTVFAKEDNYAAIAAQCLYGKNFNNNIRQANGGIEDRAAVSDARFSYLLMAADFDSRVAGASALRFNDKSALKGGKYLYRVMPAGGITQGRIDTGAVLITNARIDQPAHPEIGEAIAFDKTAEIHWNRAGHESWTGFFVERSEDGEHFRPLTNVPFVSSPPDTSVMKKDSAASRLFARLQTQYVYADSLPQNYKTYTYRIRGIDPFSELSGYSNQVTVRGKDLTPPVPPALLTPTFLGNRSLRISWVKERPEADCRGYFITRAHSVNGPYETINKELLPVTTTSYTDGDAYAHGGTYYIVATVDTAGNVSSSMPVMAYVPDKTPPAAPVGLKGKIDRNGLVTLSWDANREEDVRGYKVYFANADNHVFTQITSEPDSLTNFVDSITLRTLTKNIWYKVVAVDDNNNHSEFSQVLKLKKPDLVPPTPPQATNVVAGSRGAEMDWIQSSSEDAVEYLVYRSENNGFRTLVAKFKHQPDQTAFHFSDTLVSSGLHYLYTAETVDEDSLHSPLSIPVSIVVHLRHERPAITGLKAMFDEKQRKMMLAWAYQAPEEFFFVLLRGETKESLVPLRSLDKNTQQFNDFSALSGKTYWYAIRAVFKDDKGDTKLSDPVMVTIR